MSKYDNNQVLRDLMSDCKLRPRDVVDLLTSEYGSVSQKAVESWIYDARSMPGPTLELLTIKIKTLAQQQPSQS